MKRFLAAALAATMMLSVLLAASLFPASADDSALAADNRVLASDDTLFPGTRVSGWGTPAIDGTKDEAVYQEFSRISDNIDGKSSNASFDIWYANDGEHLYFYLEVTVPSGNTNKVVLNNNDLTRLYIDFFNQHTQIYQKTENEYQVQILNTDTSKNQKVAGSADSYNGGQFAYTPNSGAAVGSRGAAAGIGSVANGDVIYKIQYSDDAQADVNGYIIEARIDLPDYIQTDIEAELQPIIGVGYEVRNNVDQPQYNLTYNDMGMVPLENGEDYFSWLWADYTVAPDLVLSNDSDTNKTDLGLTSPICEDVSGKTITIDGKMGADEGWAGLPYVYLDSTTDNGTSISGPVTGVAPEIYLGADENYVYAFYETANLDSVWMYFQYGFGEEVTGEDAGLFVEARIDLQQATDGSYGFRYKYGSGTYSEGDDFYDNSRFAVLTENGKKYVEIQIPIPQSVKQARVNGAFPMTFGALERISDKSDAGYISSAGFSWSAGKIALTLPQTDDPEAADLPQWIEDSKKDAYHDSMKNLTVNIIGDSYFKGNGLLENHVWPALLAAKYDWTFFNYGQNGNMVSTYNDVDDLPLVKRYRQMTNNAPDIVMINGGRNDYNNGVPIGTLDSTDTDTFMGALNVMFKGLRDKYPDAMMIFTTVWNFPNTNTESELTYLDYAQAAEQVCEKWGIYCFKAYDPAVSGVDMTDETFRAAYCMSPDDISHLNLSGMKLVMPKYEQFIADSLADWAVNKDEILAGLEENDPEPGPDDGDEESTTGPAETTAPGTGAETTAPAGGEEGGCKSSLALPVWGLMAVMTVAVAAAFGRRREKRSMR